MSNAQRARHRAVSRKQRAAREAVRRDNERAEYTAEVDASENAMLASVGTSQSAPPHLPHSRTLLRLQTQIGNAAVSRLVAESKETRDSQSSSAPAPAVAATSAVAAPTPEPASPPVKFTPGPAQVLPKLTLPPTARPKSDGPDPLTEIAQAERAIPSAAEARQAAPPKTPLATAPPDALTQPAPPAERSAAPAAAFREPDVAALAAQGNADGNVRAEEKLRARLATDRSQAQNTVDTFVQQRRSMTDTLATAQPQMAQQVALAESTALENIEAALRTSSREVSSGVAAAISAVNAQASTARSQIRAAHSTTSAEIRASTQRVRAALTEASKTAAQQATTAESTQLDSLNGLYTGLIAAFKSAGVTAGDLAVARAATFAADYRSHRINRSDGWLDGHLTDNRCEAQAEAAEKVGAGYRTELIKEGDKQAGVMRDRKPTDVAAVRSVTSDTRSSLLKSFNDAIKGLEDSERQSLSNADAARDKLVSQVNRTARATVNGLQRHQSAQVAQLEQHATARRQSVRMAAGHTRGQITSAIDGAVRDSDSSLTMLVDELNKGEQPDPKLLGATLTETGAQFDQRMATFTAGIAGQTTQAASRIAEAGAQGAAALGEARATAMQATTTTRTGAVGALNAIASQGRAALQRIAAGHADSAGKIETGYRTATEQVLAGQTQAYAKLNSSLSEGAKHNVEAVQKGLVQAVEKDMPGTVRVEAKKARDQVQPRWKKVLKWVIIIAIVLVVAIVVGPLVVGAFAGAATALGTSAIVGTIIGGAVVGAATSATITVIDNAFAGRALTTGLRDAVVYGAIGGGIGGAASGLLSGPLQGLSTLSRVGIQVGVDMTIDTGLNLVSGNLTWENFGTSLAMSVLVNGVSVHPKVAGFQERLTSRGFGQGYDVGASVRSRITGTGGPGSAGPVTVDVEHISKGDTVTSPNSPYFGKWKWGKGGHGQEFRNRVTNEAGPPYDTQITSATKDPITKVAIDDVTRNQLQGPPNNPTPVINQNTGQPGVAQERKSMFPPSMDRPAIDAAAKRALDLALAGAPGSKHDPTQRLFSAVVTTPEGHPIVVEGRYATDPASGQRVIKTAYPASDRAALEIPVVKGSRTHVPGAATPPNYHQGEDKERQ